MSNDNRNNMMTVREFATLIRLSEYTVREKARANCWKFARKIGNQWRFARVEALRYVKAPLD